MSELENIDNVEQSTGEVSGEVSGEVTEPEVIEVEDNSNEIEAEQERLRQEHEEFLNSFPDTTVFYRDLLVNGNVKSLGTVVRDPHVAEQWGFLDNHFDESELTYVGTPECGTWYLKGYEKPEPSLEELKAQKLAEISAEAHKYSQYECAEMYLTSSRGFRINADGRAQDNLKGLIGIGLTCKFKDYDNEFHDGITVEDLNLMLLECYQNGASLYQQKFAYEARVDAAESREDLYFDIVFDMADFSAK